MNHQFEDGEFQEMGDTGEMWQGSSRNEGDYYLPSLLLCCLQETVWKNVSASLVTVKDTVFKILWAVVQVLGRVGVAVH